MRVVFAVFTLLALAGTTLGARIDSLRIEKDQILINGKPARLWGVRVASAACRDEYTSELISSLGTYAKSEVNALVVYYQGSSGQTAQAFAPDGKSFADKAVHDRMLRIIDAARDKGMVVIVGLFVPRKMGKDGQDPKLESAEAYLNGVKLVAGELKDRRNVLLCIAHEPGRLAWASAPIKWTIDDATAALDAAAQAAPDVPRGIGGTDAAFNVQVAALPTVSVLFHLAPGGDPPVYKVEKPSIQLALFGKDSDGRDPQGAWSDIHKQRFAAAISKYKSSTRDHLMAHFQGWHEGGMDLKPNRFSPGGTGTKQDPGTIWYLDQLARALEPPKTPQAPDKPDLGPKPSIFEETEAGIKSKRR